MIGQRDKDEYRTAYSGQMMVGNIDAHFIEQVIPHYEDAITMASMLKNGTNRPEMKKLADDIISAQTSEIEFMRGWLMAWEK